MSAEYCMLLAERYVARARSARRRAVVCAVVGPAISAAGTMAGAPWFATLPFLAGCAVLVWLSLADRRDLLSMARKCADAGLEVRKWEESKWTS